jgi:hypothetical protein
VCAWAIARGNRRLFHGIALLALLAVWATLVRIDPRNAGTFNPFAGGYEREFLDVLPDAPHTIGERLYEALRHSLPAAFFGEQMAPFSILASLLVLASCALLFKRHALWAWMVFIAFAITLLASTEARYYIMVLPMMLLGWILMLLEIMKRLSPKWATIVLVIGLGIVTANNLSADVGFIREQRDTPFIEGYKRGRYVTLLRTCDLVRTRVGDEERVLGPLASVMRYVTGKHVLSQREVLPRGSVLSYPQALYAAKLNYAIFPSNIYRAKEPFIARLMERNILYPIRKVGWDSRPNGKWYLARVRVRVPDVPDWRELPKGWTPPKPPAPVNKASKKQKKPAANASASR